MKRAILLVGVSGCILDTFGGHHRTTGELGVNARRFIPPAGAPVAFRATTGAPAPKPDQPAANATTASLRFTQDGGPFYIGGEAEVGRLETSTSNVAGGYGVLGARGLLGPVALGVEIVGGWRAVRTDVNAPDVDRWIAEPRARADLWVGPQITLGAAVGATLGEQVWMAGVYVGVHSADHEGDSSKSSAATHVQQ